MLESIKGCIIDIFDHSLLIQVGPVTLQVETAPGMISDPLLKGKEVELYVSLQFREVVPFLCGFLKRGEKRLFERLLSVRGVGPKVALAIVATFPLPKLLSIVQREEHQALCTVPGIGKKSAERLLLELRDRLTDLTAEDPAPYHGEFDLIQDAMKAMVQLGYPEKKAEEILKKAVQTLSSPFELQNLLSAALKLTI